MNLSTKQTRELLSLVNNHLLVFRTEEEHKKEMDVFAPIEKMLGAELKEKELINEVIATLEKSYEAENIDDDIDSVHNFITSDGNFQLDKSMDNISSAADRDIKAIEVALKFLKAKRIENSF